jgi:excisionase family DNA binding protein
MTPMDLEQAIVDSTPEQLPALIGLLATLTAKAQVKLMTGQVPVTREAEDLLTVSDVAKRLSLSAYTVYELCRKGLIPSRKCGKSVRIAPSALADYLVKQGD